MLTGAVCEVSANLVDSEVSTNWGGDVSECLQTGFWGVFCKYLGHPPLKKFRPLFFLDPPLCFWLGDYFKKTVILKIVAYIKCC